jgi:hypothetical protein
MEDEGGLEATVRQEHTVARELGQGGRHIEVTKRVPVRFPDGRLSMRTDTVRVWT